MQAETLLSEHGVTPGLAVVLVGNRTDSRTYVRMKRRAADEVGFHSVDRKFDEAVTQAELIQTVRALNVDPTVHAILVQLPLPKHIDEAAVLEEIAVEKDVDGFSAASGTTSLKCPSMNSSSFSSVCAAKSSSFDELQPIVTGAALRGCPLGGLFLWRRPRRCPCAGGAPLQLQACAVVQMRGRRRGLR